MGGVIFVGRWGSLSFFFIFMVVLFGLWWIFVDFKNREILENIVKNSDRIKNL